MNVQTQEIYSEVYSILNLLGESYIAKLPTSLFNMIREEKRQDYNPKYDLKTNLGQQNIKRETLAMIALLHFNYWCDSEEEKNKLKEIFKTNEEKYQAEIKEKYNPDNLFKNRKQTTTEQSQPVQDDVALVPVKETFITKIIKKLKDIAIFFKM